MYYADIVIHNEAARATEPDTLIGILAGDPKQGAAISLPADAHSTEENDKDIINQLGPQ